MVAPLLEGEYGGKCALPGKDKLAKATFHVAPDGKIDAAGQLADFKSAKELSLQWINQEDTQFMGASATIGDAMVTLTTHPLLKETTASLKRGNMAVRCESTTLAARLSAARPHLLAADLLASAPKRISCASNKDGGPAFIQYAYKAGILTVNGEAIRINTVENETLSFSQGFKTVAYSASLKGNRNLVIFFDNAGKMTKLDFPSGVDSTASCVVKSK